MIYEVPLFTHVTVSASSTLTNQTGVGVIESIVEGETLQDGEQIVMVELTGVALYKLVQAMLTRPVRIW